MPKGRYKPLSAITSRHKRRLMKLQPIDTKDKGVLMSSLIDGDNLAIMEVLASIKNEIKDLKKEMSTHTEQHREALESISQRLDGQMGVMEEKAASDEMANLHSLPVANIQDLIALDFTLCNSNAYKKYLVQYLKERSTGILHRCSNKKQVSAGLNKTVYDMCSALMTNEVAVNFCMKGRSEDKLAFEVNFKGVIDVIFEGVKSKSVLGLNIDMPSVKRSIGEWFRWSKSRTVEGKLAKRNYRGKSDSETIVC